ncbi:MFS transporter [Gryllotalpicola koreensis]|uniref:MFS transporter n=1 Tax=Gryllotalpicola koreensis TaxID=993086 RepID=A0ABP8A1H8_9MICO
MRETSVWRNRNFQRLWIGESLSQLGENLGTLAIPVIAVVMLHATAQEVGYLTAAQQLAFLVIGLPVGAWVDRMRKRRVMITADAVRAAALLTIPAAWLLGALHIWQLYAVAAVVGGATVFFDVTYQSIVPRLVSSEHVAPANSGLETSAQVARVGGPALSGALLAVVKAPLLLFATALGYLASMIAVATIRDEEPKRPASDHSSLVAEIGEGLRFVFTHSLLTRITINTGAMNLFDGLMTTLVPLFVLRQLHFTPTVYGVVEGIGAAGGILGALATPWLMRRVGEGSLIVWSALGTALGSAVFMLAAVFPAAAIPFLIAGMFVFSFTVLNYNIAQVSFRQRLCPPRLLGRMNASIRFVVWGVMPVSAAAAGWLGGWFGVVPTMWLGVALSAAATMAVLLFSPLRSMRKLPSSLESADTN